MTEYALAKIQFLIAGAVMIGILSVVYLETPGLHPKPAHSISAGMKIQAPRGYLWPSNTQTLVLVLRVGCGHCENEMYFYENLLDLQRMGVLGVHLVAFLPNSEKEVREAFSGRLVGMEKIAGVEMQSLDVKGTPTLILVNPDGKVSSTWVGEIRSDEKESMIRIFNRTDNSSTR